MFVRRRIVRGSVYCQVLESYRVNGTPKHRVVTAWAPPPASLADAIRDVEEQVAWRERSLARMEQGEQVFKPGPGRSAKQARRQNEQYISELQQSLDRLRPKLAGLREAHAALGDWRDPGM
jgi:hypothetical protein